MVVLTKLLKLLTKRLKILAFIEDVFVFGFISPSSSSPLIAVVHVVHVVNEEDNLTANEASSIKETPGKKKSFSLLLGEKKLV